MAVDDHISATAHVAQLLGMPPESEGGAVLRAFAEKFGTVASKLAEPEVELFDIVFLDLVRAGDVNDRAALAEALAPIPNAPRKLVIDLAFDDAIIVAGPLLKASQRLDEEILLTIVSEKGPQHLACIAVRPTVPERLSDRLIERGDETVLLALVNNSGASFSEAGRVTAVERSFAWPDVFIAIDRRSDFGKAILAAYAKPNSGQRILVNGARREVDAEVAALVGKGEVDRALALVAIEAQTRYGLTMRLYRQDTLDTFVLVARAAELSWGTLVGLLLNHLGVGASANEINRSRRLFENTTRGEALSAIRTITLTEARLTG